jgi:hypothetical protein
MKSLIYDLSVAYAKERLADYLRRQNDAQINNLDKKVVLENFRGWFHDAHLYYKSVAKTKDEEQFEDFTDFTNF